MNKRPSTRQYSAVTSEEADSGGGAAHDPGLSKGQRQRALEDAERAFALEATSVSPEDKSSFFSKLFFCWLNPLLELGTRKPLEEEDLFALAERDKISHVAQQFRTAWHEQAVKGTHWKYLAYTLFQMFGWQYFLAGLPKLVVLAAEFVYPILLTRFITYAGDDSADMGTGFLLLFLIALSWGASVMSQEHYWHRLNIVTMNIESSLCTAVYQKSLKVHGLRRGNATNVMNVDPEKLAGLGWCMHRVWSFPTQFLLSTYLLWRWLGASALVPVAFMFVLAPFNKWMLGNLTKAEDEVMKFKDLRIKKLTEVLQGILVTKLFSWEDRMADRVQVQRAKEIKQLKRFAYLLAALMFFILSLSSILCVSTFTAYALLGHELKAEKVFPSLVVIRSLMWTILLLPATSNRFSEAYVSIRRLNSFMRLRELPHFSKDQEREDAGRVEPHVRITNNAAFSWHSHEALDGEASDDDEGDERPLLPVEEVSSENGSCSDDDDDGSQQDGDIHLRLLPQHDSLDDDNEDEDEEKGGSAEKRGFCLQDIELSAGGNDLIAVIGRVGAGKSALLLAILEEMECQRGSVDVQGSVAYVPQQAWIRNATVRDNILFGHSFDQQRYNTAVKVCALADDLKWLPAADNTEIGEKGVNISGGQKQRISLARAVYANTDIVLLDDPLSAVDAHVGQHLFEQCIAGAMSGKLRVLVTHQLQFLAKADRILVMENGRIQQDATYTELCARGFDFAKLLAEQQKAADDAKAAALAARPPPLVLGTSLANGGRPYSDSTTRSPEENKGCHRMPFAADLALPVCAAGTSPFGVDMDDDGLQPVALQRHSSAPPVMYAGDQSPANGAQHINPPALAVPTEDKDNVLVTISIDEPKDAPRAGSAPDAGRTVEDEERATGTVSFSVYRSYMLGTGGWRFLIFLFFVSVGFQASSTYSSVWLSVWSDSGDDSEHGVSYYLGIYIALSITGQVLSAVRQFAWAKGTLDCSKKMHDNLLRAILRAPMSFFYKTPTGRIVNRFSRDMGSVDSNIPDLVSDFFLGIFAAGATVVTLFAIQPWLTVASIPVVVLYVRLQRSFRKSCRELGRLRSITRSPIFAQYNETLDGVRTVRAFSEEAALYEQFLHLMTRNYRPYSIKMVANRWLGVRLSLLGLLGVLSVCLLGVVEHGRMSAAMVGLALALAQEVMDTLGWYVRVSANLEAKMNNVERIIHYTATPSEAALVVEHEEDAVPMDWPHAGAIRFDDVYMRYRPDLPFVLHGISLTIKPQEKIGIVGRTGAGKSSITSMLFRLVEPARGHIYIDEVDTSSIGLRRLRNNIAIIPQDPVLFGGTIRGNLDPFKQHSDEAVRDALHRVHLSGKVESLPKGIYSKVTENGGNLSVGERQLICMGRALLKKTNILVLDEATASVDTETDRLIQRTVRDEFKERTMLTIAHRLDTIMDSDRLLVLDRGRVVEFDTPDNLLHKPDGYFKALFEQTQSSARALAH